MQAKSQNIFEQVFQNASNMVKVRPPQSTTLRKNEQESEGRVDIAGYKSLMQSVPDFSKTPMKPLRSTNLRKPPTRVPCTPQAKKIVAIPAEEGPSESDISVYVRIRPLLEYENRSDGWKVDGRTITTSVPQRSKEFVFTDVLGDCSQQRDVFKTVAMPLLCRFMHGSDGLLLAYGASQTGKSYTIKGTPEEPGLIPQVTKILLETDPPKGTERGIIVSCVEVYNEKIIDLFGDSSRPLRIARDGFGFTSANGVTEFEITSEADIQRALRDMDAAKRKHISKGSRSHSIFTLKLVTIPLDPRTKKRTNDIRQIKCTKLSIVDLAGCERVSPDSMSAVNVSEACNINKSMLALGKCIRHMRKNGKGKPAPSPFRESKLTEMLKDFFEPCPNRQSAISIVVTISPGRSQFDDTFNALTFGSSAVDSKARAGDEDDDDFQIHSIDFDEENGDNEPLDMRLLAQKEAEIRQKAHEEMAEMARKMQDDYQRSIQQLRAQSAEPYTAKVQQALAQRMKREAKSRELAECIRERDAVRQRCDELEKMVSSVESQIIEKQALLDAEIKKGQTLEVNVSKMMAGTKVLCDRFMKMKQELEQKIAEKEAFWMRRVQDLVDEITRLKQ